MQTSFILPANFGGIETPESVERKRKIAELLAAHASQNLGQPIRSPWQGAAQLAGILMGELGGMQANRAEARGRKSAADEYASIIAPPDRNPMQEVSEADREADLMKFMGNPWASEGQTRIAGALLEPMLKKRTPSWKTFNDPGTGDVYRYNENDPESAATKFFSATPNPTDVLNRKKLEQEIGSYDENQRLAREKLQAEINALSAKEEPYNKLSEGEELFKGGKKIAENSKKKPHNVNMTNYINQRTGEIKMLDENDPNNVEVLNAMGANGEWRVYTPPLIDKGESEYDKEMGKILAGDYRKIAEDAGNAEIAIGNYDIMMSNLDAQGMYTGIGAPTALLMGQVLKALGYEMEGVADMETFRAVSYKSIKDEIGSLGSAVSDGDRRFVENANMQLTTTQAGNRMIIAIKRRMAERKIQMLELANKHKEKHGGRLTEDFWAERSKFVKANRLFTDEEMAQIRAVAKAGAEGKGVMPEGITFGQPKQQPQQEGDITFTKPLSPEEMRKLTPKQWNAYKLWVKQFLEQGGGQ